MKFWKVKTVCTFLSQEYAVILLITRFLIQTDIVSFLREMYTRKLP